MPPLATAFVRILPDLSEFKSATDAGVQKAAKTQGTAAASTFGGSFSKELNKGAEKTAGSWQSQLGAQLGKRTKQLAKVGAAGLVGIGVASVKMATDFQKGLETLVTGAGETEKNIGLIGNGIKRISVESGTSTKELVSGMYLIESAGFRGQNGLRVLQAAAEGAKVGVADMSTVANAATTVLTDYHESGAKATQVVNGLTAVVSQGKVHLDDLAGSIGRVLPTAASLGVSFDQVGGALSTLTSEGTSARLATQGLNSTMIAMAAPNATAVKQMQALGLTSHSVSDELTKHGLIAALKLVTDSAAKEFPRGSAEYIAAVKNMVGGNRGLQVALQLTGSHLSTLEKDTTAVGKAMDEGGKHVHGFELVQKSSAFAMEQLRATLEVTMITIGSKLIPVLTSFLNLLLRLHLVIPLVAVAMGVLTAAVIAQAAAWAVTPVGEITLALIALIAVVVLVGKNWHTIWAAMKAIVLDVWDWIVAHWPLLTVILAGPVGAAAVIIIRHWHDIAAVIYGIWNWITAHWPLLVQILAGPFAQAADAIIAHLRQIAAGILAIWDWITGHWHELTAILSDPVAAAANFIIDHFRGIWTVISSVFGFILNGAAKAFGWIPGLGGKLRDAAAQFAAFRDHVNQSIGSLNDKTIKVGVQVGLGVNKKPGPGGGFAGGGTVQGPGTTTSDSILARLSNNEYVMRASSVAKYGVGMMDAINTQRFAQGGSVGGGVSVRPYAPTQEQFTKDLAAAVRQLATSVAQNAVATGDIGGRGGVALPGASGLANYASSFAGKVPYVWGGTSPAGWDCSGFVEWIYDRYGFSPPRTSESQFGWVRRTAFPVVGGLAFFAGSDGTQASPGHVGIVTGPNRMVDAYGTGYGTRFDSIIGSSGAISGYGIPPGGFKRGGLVRQLAKGGVISEPVSGVGLLSGAAYSLGESGSETVVPGDDLGSKLDVIASLLASLIGEVSQVAPRTAAGLGGAMSTAARAGSHKAYYGVGAHG